MQVVRVNIKNPPQLKPCVATIGNFDGLHLGHQSIINDVVSKAHAANLPAVVMTFSKTAYEYFHTDAGQRITKTRDKLYELQQLGVDIVCFFDFNKDVAALDATTFAKEILAGFFSVQEIIVGADCRFGKGRAGDVALLRKYLPRVTVAETLLISGNKISSSLLRSACAAGDLEQVSKLRARSLTISGHVAYGNQRGRELGFPTANIFLPSQLRLLHGVFVVKSKFSSKVLHGVANIGSRPTISDGRWVLEVYFFDIDINLYGKILCVEILHKLRSEQRFSGLEALQQQIVADVRAARDYFEPGS